MVVNHHDTEGDPPRCFSSNREGFISYIKPSFLRLILRILLLKINAGVKLFFLQISIESCIINHESSMVLAQGGSYKPKPTFAVRSSGMIFISQSLVSHCILRDDSRQHVNCLRPSALPFSSPREYLTCMCLLCYPVHARWPVFVIIMAIFLFPCPLFCRTALFPFHCGITMRKIRKGIFMQFARPFCSMDKTA